jgi:hypothetical protein
MWFQVEADLTSLLSARIYPNLLTDAFYRRFLTLAGLPAGGQPGGLIPPALRANFDKAAKISAGLAVAAVSKSGGIEEISACAKLLKPPIVLCRFWDATAPERREGIWWFDKRVVDLAKHHGGKTAAERLRWLREHLAVPLDWSGMSRIDLISLGGDNELPAIEGNGTRQRMYSPTALYEGNAARGDYWKNLTTYLPGGVKQIVLPFIPQSIGEDLNRFLSHS